MEEERMSRMETDLAVVKSNVIDMKEDIRELRTDVRRLDDKVDGINKTLTEKFDDMKDSNFSARIWALGLYIAFAAGMLTVMARGFKWI